MGCPSQGGAHRPHYLREKQQGRGQRLVSPGVQQGWHKVRRLWRRFRRRFSVAYCVLCDPAHPPVSSLASLPSCRWFGKCWTVVDLLTYEFEIEFEMPVTYPASAPEIALPELDGKTAKMYRGGKICLTDHFKPLWARNQPRFGVAHAMALGLGPWLAVEIPDLVSKGMIAHKENTGAEE
eukprot:m.68873 g.68873  ORF g.68873 m.68873 type:complete len:180 (+) comp13935_c1_seq1:261-800(+)